MCLDVEKPFDNIRHTAILQAISDLSLVERFLSYVRSFLSGRTASLRIGNVSEPFYLGDIGTLQGSVLSPFLFHLAMSKLATTLPDIKGVEHTIYADDVTLWSAGGSDGELKARLQEAIRATELYLATAGLKCY